MKATVKQVVECYKALGEAKVTKLEESEVIKIVKTRKAMRPIVQDYEEFEKDLGEKLKPEGFDKVVETYNAGLEKLRKDSSYVPTSEENESAKVVIEQVNRIEAAKKDELDKEVELDFESLKEESATKMLVENGWSVGKLDEIEIVL